MKKVLIVTYYWPPAGGPGVQRWLKFVKYLPEFGIEPIVYVPDNPSYPIIDEKLQRDVLATTTIIRGKIFEPYSIASLLMGKKSAKMSSGIIPEKQRQGFLDKLALWVRGNLFIPDARVFWVRRSVKVLKEYIRENGIEMMITTGPPHSLHLIGLRLKKETGVKWIADFRDPWTTIGYHSALNLTSVSRAKHKKLESEVLNSADQIIVTSPTTKSEFESITAKPIAVITNGHDLHDSAVVKVDEKFSVSHIGSLLSKRNPETLWQVLSELVVEKQGFANDLNLKLIGTVSSEVIHSIRTNGLGDYLEVVGYVAHEKAVEFQKSAQVLLLIEIDSEKTRSIIPGKLFEYMVSGRPVLAIGPKGSDMEPIIDQTRIGTFAAHQDKERMKNALSQWHDEFVQDNLWSDARDTDKYSRRNLTLQLAELIKST